MTANETPTKVPAEPVPTDDLVIIRHVVLTVDGDLLAIPLHRHYRTGRGGQR